MTYRILLKTAKAKKSLPQALTPQLPLSNYLILDQSLQLAIVNILANVYLQLKSNFSYVCKINKQITI